MSSKLLVRLAGALALVMGLSACNITTNDPPAKPSSINIKSLDSGCLNSSGETLANYFNGSVSDNELDGMWDCLFKSFQNFVDNTRGHDPNNYSGEELARFLERYFLKDKVIQPALVRQAMNLKQAVLGGDPQLISRPELYRTLDLIKMFKRESRRLRQFLPLDPNLPQYSNNPERLEVALGVFISVADNIGANFAETAQTYSFEDFRDFLHELELFFEQGHRGPDTTAWLRTAQSYIDVIKWSKSVFIVPPETQISQGDWAQVFKMVSRYMATYIRSRQVFAGRADLLSNNGITRLRGMLTDLHGLLSESIRSHDGYVISFDDFDKLIITMNDKKLLPVGGDVLRQFLRVLFEKILRPPTVTYGQAQTGLRRENLDRFMLEFNLWTEGQSYLNGLYGQLAGGTSTPGLSRADLLSVSPEDAIKWTFLKNQISTRAIGDLQHTMEETPPLFYGEDAAISLPLNHDQELYSHHNMTMMNGLKRVTLLLIDAYKSYLPPPPSCNRDDPACKPPVSCSAADNNGQEGLNKQQVTAMFGDFFNLLVSLGYLSESGRDMAPSRFFEASLFLNASNGNGCLEINEATEMLASLFSVASKAKEAWNDIAETGGCSVKKDPATGKVMIETPCVYTTLYQRRAKYWAQVPGLVKFIDKFGVPSDKPVPSEVSAIYKAIFELAKDKDPNNDHHYMALGEFQGFMLMPYYVEMIFDRFDMNNNGGIDQKEGVVAFQQVFKDYLQANMYKFGLANTEKNAAAAYSYLLAKGDAPKGCLQKIMFFLFWRNNYKHQKYEADRLRVYNIFSMLISKLNSTPSPRVADQPSDCPLIDWLSKLLKGKKSSMTAEEVNHMITAFTRTDPSFMVPFNDDEDGSGRHRDEQVDEDLSSPEFQDFLLKNH